MKQYRHLIENINYLSFLLLLIVLPYPGTLARIMYAVWIGSWVLEFRWIQRPDFTKYGNNKHVWIPLLGIGIFYLWQLLSLFWSIDLSESCTLLLRHLAIILLIPVILWGVNKHYQLTTILRTIIITCCISVFVYLFANFWVMNADMAINTYIPIRHHLNLFTLNSLTLEIKHRFYYSIWLNTAICALPFAFHDTINRYGKWATIVTTTLVTIILLAGIYWSGSRQGVITVAIVGATIALLHSKTSTRGLTLSIIIPLLIGACYTMLNYHPRVKEHSLQEWLSYEPESQEPALEPRLAIWKATIENKSEFLILGVGIGCSERLMADIYEEKGWDIYQNRHFSPHNQYLNFWVELGILGLLLSLLLFGVTPLCFTDRARRWAILMAVVLLTGMITESLFVRTEGIHFYTITLLITYLFAPGQSSHELAGHAEHSVPSRSDD